MITKDMIIEKLRDVLKPLPYIYALWLEGADANGTADEYSDIDIWVDFEDAYEKQAISAVETTLCEISEIDYKYFMPNDQCEKIRFRRYHLAGTSKYLVIDFQWQFHSRPKDEFVFFENNKIEAAKVIFDKESVIKYKPLDLSKFHEPNLRRLEEAKYRMTQLMRVEKYIHRNQYLEAYDHYNCYVLQSLIDLLRLIYTPSHAHYAFCHISQHIPKANREKLEYFSKINSFEDITEKMPQAKKWFEELLQQMDNLKEMQ